MGAQRRSSLQEVAGGAAEGVGVSGKPFQRKLHGVFLIYQNELNFHLF